MERGGRRESGLEGREGTHGLQDHTNKPVFFDRCREGHHRLCMAEAPALNTPNG